MLQRLAAATILLLLAACTPGTSGAQSNKSKARSIRLAEVTAPVEVALGSIPAVTGHLRPDKALTLETTDAGGTHFKLEFAVGSAPYPITVSMRAVDRVTGLKGSVAAVDLQPSGLRLRAPAVLTVDGPGAAKATGFTFEGSPAMALPELVVPTPGPLRIVVGHFSGYGAAGDAPAQWDIRTISPQEARELITLERSAIANAFNQHRQGIFTEAEMWNIINNALEAITIALERAASSAIEKANTGDPSVANQTEILDYLVLLVSESRVEQLATSSETAAAMARVVKIVDRYARAVAEHCAKFHDLSVYTLILSLVRGLAQYAGESDGGALDGIRRCFAAEVRFRTTVSFSKGGPSAWRFGAIVPVNLFDGIFPGRQDNQPVSYTPVIDPPATWALVQPDCIYKVTAGDGQFSVLQARLTPAAPPTPPPGPTPSAVPIRVTAPLKFADAVVEFNIGNPYAHMVEISGPCGSPVEIPYFSFVYELSSLAVKSGDNTYLWDRGFEVPNDGGPVLARRTLDNSLGGNHSVSTIEIVHTPK